MDFQLSAKEIALQSEFEIFFSEEMKYAPDVFKNGVAEGIFTEEGFKFHKYLARKLGEKGWISMAWPKEYGGGNASIMEQIIFNEVREKYNAPGIDIMGVVMFAPSVMIGGTDEQKRRILPKIAGGEVVYCQGWSEPDAGSDLASLSTTAIRDGEYYVINGQKIWTSGAHRADYMFMLARTDPESRRSKGLSILNVKMDLPGIEVRPLLFMDKKHLYNEVFFKDVRVPVSELVGREGEGWMLTRHTMNFERSGASTFTFLERILNEIVAYMRVTRRNGKFLYENTSARRKIAELYTEIEAGKSLSYKIAWLQQKGDMFTIAPLASGVKLFTAELTYRIADYGSQIMGLFGQLSESKWAPLNGSMAELYQFATGFKIGGGTNEIQRDIIAWTGLGLPRIK